MIRRAKEELGIEVDPYEVFHFTYYEDFGDLAEYELDHVYLAQFEGELHPDPMEIGEIRRVRKSGGKSGDFMNPNAMTGEE